MVNRVYLRAVLVLWLALLASSELRAANSEAFEPVTRGDYGWDMNTPVGEGWLPHVATNRTGTFLRRGDALVLLESMDTQLWQSIQASFRFGGIAPASTLGTIYLLLLAAGVTSVAARIEVAQPFLVAASGVSFLAAINSWFWQLRSLANHGLYAGIPYMLANTAGGVESHYYGMRAFQYAQQNNVSVQPRLANTKHHLIVLATLFAGSLGRTVYTGLTGNMVDSLTLSLPHHLLERGFITLIASRSGPELRIHRIPKVLRKEGFEDLRESESIWHSLLKVMDRDRIDRLSIQPLVQRGKLVLQLRFLDNQSSQPATLFVETHMPGIGITWLEQMLTDGNPRVEEHTLQSLLHPTFMQMIITALSCLPKLTEQETFHHCGSNVLLQTGEQGSRQLRWVQSEGQDRVDLPQLWPSKKNDRTLFYFEQPLNEHAPFLSWIDGPALALRDGHDAKAEAISQYHIGEHHSQILASELDYLVRYLPHGVLGLVVMPFVQSLSPACQFTDATAQTLNQLELMTRNYAPGWMTNLGTVIGLMQRVLGWSDMQLSALVPEPS